MNPIQSILLSFIALSLCFTIRMIRKSTTIVVVQQAEQNDGPVAVDSDSSTTTATSLGASIFNNKTTIDWRDEMLPLSSSPSLSFNISNIRKATYTRDYKGCGVSMKIKFNDDTSTSTSTSPDTSASLSSSQQTSAAFFKLQISENNTHYDAETHLREILASYLDTLLQTNVVPPCIGYRLPINEKKTKNIDQDMKNQLISFTSCSNNTSDTDNDTSLILDGSLMMHVPNITQIRRGYEIAYMAYKEFHPIAIKYAIFLYVAGCVKSRHNHFGVRHLDPYTATVYC